ncbi:alpha/beta hydrolase [Maritimibacter sp. 55A14]|uniref:alpha/beta fold hydrolase n=1 Tax=Maritimibacter sp. 55A14 TaxID=2174844 RepID=UPI000D614906|nr:alpha/beta hydrolase [Maritimibacter sp. 55A14]PWE32003.1 alpha/beta hydrolase [Maritimibacter sp. 55A14]
MTDPLLLLPGMICDARLFGPQIAALSSLFTLQIGRITKSESIERIALDVLRDAPERFALAGAGMGGSVAMEVLRRAPERVSRLALIDTDPFAESSAAAADRDPQIARVRAGGLAEVARELVGLEHLAPGPRRDEVQALVVDMACRIGEAAFIRQSRAMQRRPDQQALLRRVKVPALVLCGELDTLCPVRRHELMATLIPEARLVTVPEAGHMPSLEHPAAVTEALGDWLYT